ncbi:MAG: hypothetical protein ABI947_10900 [Chloroflexota bacterium]
MSKKLKKAFLLLTKFAVSLALIVLALLEAFSIIRIDAGTLALLGFVIVLWTLPQLRESIKSIEMPNLIKLELNPILKDIEQRAIAAGLMSGSKVEIGGGAESSFGVGLAIRDSKLGLAWIRIELEKRLLDLGERANVTYRTVYELTDLLVSQQYLSEDERYVLDKLLFILDESIRGSRVISKEDTMQLLNVGEEIIVALDRKLKYFNLGGVG